MSSDKAKKIRVIHEADPDDLAQAEANRDPMQFVSEADWEKYRGQFVAILCHCEDQGQIVASGSSAVDVRKQIRQMEQGGNDPLRGRAFTIRHLERDD